MTVSPPPTDTDRLAEALREHRDGLTVTGDREQDYRPGVPCMDCGDYPGPRHEGSDCPRAVARALAPVVEQMRRESAAEAWDEGYRSGHSNAMRRMSDEPHAPTTTNPYAAALAAAAPTERTDR